jgi:hypothetical protein
LMMSHMLLLAWMVLRTLLVVEIITHGSIFVWTTFLRTLFIFKWFQGTSHVIFARNIWFDNDALIR